MNSKAMMACALLLVVQIGYSSVKNVPVKQTKIKAPSEVKTEVKALIKVPEKIKSHPLYSSYIKKNKTKESLTNLKAKTLAMKQKAVPLLTYVMRSKQFPERNRWIATFMLGRIMGAKSSNFISKFAFHPNWMMRLASLKALLALKQKQYKGIYSRLLKDKAMIVRLQALENIKKLELKELAPYVWAMLYDKKNYSGPQGQRKRGDLIKEVIRSMGDLGFKKARKPMLTMIQKKRYKDIHEELDYSLSKLSDRESPEGSISIKKHFWKKIATSELTI